MTVEGNAQVSAFGIGDLGSFNKVTMSEEEYEVEDIMVGVSGADIFFDGIYGQEDVVRDYAEGEDFDSYDIDIDDNLEIKDYGMYDVQDVVVEKDEMVSCVRAFAESFPLPGQISPQEVVAVDPSLSLKRKRDEKIDVTNGFSYSSFPFSYQEFEDFMSKPSKYSTRDKVASQLEMPSETCEDVQSRNLHSQVSEKSMTVLAGDSICQDSFVSPVKDSYWQDMVIQTESPLTLPTADTSTAWGSKVFTSRTRRLNTNMCLRNNTNNVHLVATTQKYSPVELIMSFDNMQVIPLESKLNNIFRRFGTLIEPETVIHHKSGYARVVFKKSSDAEIAVSSAKAFKIFGPSVVKYELGYAPLSAMPSVGVENATSKMQITESEVKYEIEYSQEQQMQPELISESGHEAEDMHVLKMHSEVINEKGREAEVTPVLKMDSQVIGESEYSTEETSSQNLQSKVINEMGHEAVDMPVLKMDSEVLTETENSPKEMSEQQLQSAEVRVYNPEDIPEQQMHSEHLEETYAAEVMVENEDYEGLDDVDIME